MSLIHSLNFFSSFTACSHSLSFCFQPCETWSFSQFCWWRRNYSGTQRLVAQEVGETRSKYFMTSLTARPSTQTRLTPPNRQYLPIDMTSLSRIPELSSLSLLNFYTRWMWKLRDSGELITERTWNALYRISGGPQIQSGCDSGIKNLYPSSDSNFGSTGHICYKKHYIDWAIPANAHTGCVRI